MSKNVVKIGLMVVIILAIFTSMVLGTEVIDNTTQYTTNKVTVTNSHVIRRTMQLTSFITGILLTVNLIWIKREAKKSNITKRASTIPLLIIGIIVSGIFLIMSQLLACFCLPTYSDNINAIRNTFVIFLIELIINFILIFRKMKVENNKITLFTILIFLIPIVLSILLVVFPELTVQESNYLTI